MISCDKDRYEFPNANVNLYIYPNIPQFNGLHVPENSAYRFEVDRIVGKTNTDEGDIYYLVQWKNCKSHHKLTWEKKEHLKGKTKKDEEFQSAKCF